MATSTVLVEVVLIFLVGFFSVSFSTIPEEGKWTFALSQDRQYWAVNKHMYKGSRVSVSVSLKQCEGNNHGGVQIYWILRESPCALEYITTRDKKSSYEDKKEFMIKYAYEPCLPYRLNNWMNGLSVFNCSQEEFLLPGVANLTHYVLDGRKEIWYQTSSTPAASGEVTKTNSPDVARAWEDGDYLFSIRIFPKEESSTTFKAEVTIRTTFGNGNYISLMDYPLLVFYGVCGLVYVVYGLVWLVLMVRNWRDLKRVQHLIAGTILLGILENAVFFAHYEIINNTGQSVRGLTIFAELLCSFRQTVARVLLMVVCVGFSIDRPRLGRTLVKVLVLGILYFILASTVFVYIAINSEANWSNWILLAVVAYCIVDFYIWIYLVWGLLKTLAKFERAVSITKLKLYHLLNSGLVLQGFAQIGYMIWFFSQEKYVFCSESWNELLVDKFFSRYKVFMFLLLVLMLLWRPKANNRYAFSPLLDDAEQEEEEDAVTNGAIEDSEVDAAGASGETPEQTDDTEPSEQPDPETSAVTPNFVRFVLNLDERRV